MDGSGVATTTVTLTTTARSNAMPAGNIPLVPPIPWQILPLPIALLLVAMILQKSRRAGRAARLLGASAFLTMAAFCVSCSTGSGSGPPPAQGTPAGTYTIMVTGTSGSLSHSASFQLVVK
jgi:hypothetical protein